MLILDKAKCKILGNRINEYKNYGVVLYYMYNENKLPNSDFVNIFFEEDVDKQIFSYRKILKNISSSDFSLSLEKYKKDFNDLDNDLDKINVLCIKKLVNELYDKKEYRNKLYINTYNYLLANI